MTSHEQPRSGQRAFLRRILDEGAESLGVAPIGAAVFGWSDRTIGSAATAGGGRYSQDLERLFSRALDLSAPRMPVRLSRSRSC
jgi:hypothetical protein